MKWLFAVLLSLPCITPAFCNDWELVFPEHYRLGQDHTLLSIGAKVFPDRPNEYLIGSQSGWVLAAILGEPEESTSWTPIKLPFDYDVSAVDVVNNQWIIGIVGDSGNSSGQVAIHQGVNPDKPDLADLSTGWEVHLLDPNLEVSELACVGDTVFALLVGRRVMNELHRSTDGGLNWELVQDITDVDDIEAFNGKFYLIHSGKTGAELVVSEDGLHFDSVWTITDTYGSKLWNANLSVMDKATDSVGLPTGSDLRLYVNGQLHYLTTDEYSSFGVGSRFYLSSPDGVTWFDHGSNTITGWSPGHSAFDPVRWNPLSVPDAAKYAMWPFFEEWPFLLKYNFLPVQSAGNFSLERGDYSRSLTQFDGNAPHLVNSLDNGTRIRREMISQWDRLAFVFYDQPDQARIVTIGQGGVVSVHSFPDLEPKIQYVEQMISVRGTTYVEVQPQYEYSILLTTTNFQHWNIQPWPKPGYSLELKSDGSHLIGLSPQNDVSSYRLNEDWIPGFEYAYKDEDELAFVEQTNSWYRAQQNSDDLRVFRLGETGEWENLCVMVPNAEWRYPTEMACPDGQRLVVFGMSTEMFIVETDGSWRSAYPWQSTESDADSTCRINSVCYANGWYYVTGSIKVRTRDFIEFEPVVLPDDEPLIHVTMFDGQLYGFTPNAVFKMPCEKGYLDSVESKPNWHHADWLGWFHIIDEELGDIDHLLLGKCWVKQTSKIEYWIRTEALGWIYMRSDWSPWFWRMEDGHWYWLDHDSWPGRAWDYSDQEWEELL